MTGHLKSLLTSRGKKNGATVSNCRSAAAQNKDIPSFWEISSPQAQ
jgi:hypothetical protein